MAAGGQQAGGRRQLRETAVDRPREVPLAELFLGALALCRRLGSDDGLSVGGLVLYAFAMVAVMNAAVYDGLVTASVAPHIAAAAPAASEAWQVAFRYNGQVNQAFARVFVVASGAAIVLWSVAIIRRERWPGHWDGTDACSGPSRWPPCSPGT